MALGSPLNSLALAFVYAPMPSTSMRSPMTSSGRALPELVIGDLMLVDGMGAYTNASASEFNGLPKAKIVLI